MSESAPLLAARGARLAVAGAIVTEALDFATRGDRLVVSGDADALLAALTGVPVNVSEAGERARFGEMVPLAEPASVVGGVLELSGRDVASGAHRPATGTAVRDAPLDPDAFVHDYLAAAARLSLAARGPFNRADVEREVATALARAAITGANKRRLGALGQAERRALAIGAAALADPPTLILDRPLEGLDGQAAGMVMQALERAAAGRRAIVRVAQLAAGTAEGDLARRAADCLVLAGGARVFFGPLSAYASGERVYQVAVRAGAEALREALRAAGLALEGGPDRFSIVLAQGRHPSEILRAAAAARASVVEIIPLM